MKTRNGSIYSLAALMVLMAIVIVITLNFDDFKSELLPLTFSGAVFILAGIRLLKEILHEEKRLETTDSDDAVAVEQAAVEQAAVGVWRGYLIAGAWVIGFVVGTYLIGFLPAMVLLTILYTRSHGVGWLASILLTVLTPALIWLAFEYALRVELYRGLIYTLLGY